MTLKEKRPPHEDSKNLLPKEAQSTSLISRENLIRRLKRGPEPRAKFVESHLNKSLAFQIRYLRDQEQWTQAQFAKKLGIKHPNNVSARLENPYYGKHTLTTLKKIAATCDVGLVVWFVPFSRLVDWATSTPHLDKGLSPDFYNIPAFGQDRKIRRGTSADSNPDHSDRNHTNGAKKRSGKRMRRRSNQTESAVLNDVPDNFQGLFDERE